MNAITELRLKLRAAKRIGAFSQARKRGLSVEEARVHSDKIYPPTKEDLQYEETLR